MCAKKKAEKERRKKLRKTAEPSEIDAVQARLVKSYWKHRNSGGNANQWWSWHRMPYRARLKLRGAIKRSESARYRIVWGG